MNKEAWGNIFDQTGLDGKLSASVSRPFIRGITKMREIQRGLTQEEIRFREQEQLLWKEKLGTDVVVRDLPAGVITQERKSLEERISIGFLPRLEVGALADLRKNDVRVFIKDIKDRYPSLEKSCAVDVEKPGFSSTALLDERYWGLVRDNQIPFPVFLDRWIAFDKHEKLGSTGDESLLTRLGLDKGINVSFNNGREIFTRESSPVLEHFGLSNNLWC